MTAHDTDHEHTHDGPGTAEEPEPGYFERDSSADEGADIVPPDEYDDLDDDGVDDATDTYSDVTDDSDPDVPAGPIALGPTSDEPGIDASTIEVPPPPPPPPPPEGDESVLLTETEPGSVLPPEEADESGGSEAEDVAGEEEVVDEADEADEEIVAGEEIAAEPEPDPVALVAPTEPGSAVDPGTGTFQERWSAIQGTFVDEPYRAVEAAGALVTEMWDQFERTIVERRNTLDSSWADASPTDELRFAFQQYRELFRHLQTLLTDTSPGRA
jgi:hypothetical protein